MENNGLDKPIHELTPEELKALLSQNSSSESSPSTTPDVDSALAHPTTADAPKDKSLMDQFQDWLNAKGVSATAAGQREVDASQPGVASSADTQTKDIPQPWGGLTGQALTDQIAANPGPTATTGYNPNPDMVAASKNPSPTSEATAAVTPIPTKEDEEEEEETPTKSATAPSPAESLPAPSEAPVQPTGPRDYLGDMMQKLYGNNGTDAAALQQAMKLRQYQQLNNNMAMAGQQIAAGFSRGAYKPDYALNAELAQQSNNPVNNILQQRKAQEEQIATAVKLSDFNDKQQMQDPTSPLSASARAMALQLNPKLLSDPAFKNMDYEAVVKLQPLVENKLKYDTLAATKGMQMTMMQQRQDMLDQNRKEQQAQKQAQTQAKAQFDIPSKIDNFINNRGATKLAADADRRVDNVKDILAPYANDLNKVPTTIIEPMKQEMEQIFKGASATEGSTKHLMPAGLQSKWSDLQSYVDQHPHDANMGEMIKPFLPYLDALQQNSRAYIGNAIAPQLQGASALVTDPVAYQQLHAHYDRYTSAAESKKQLLQNATKSPTAMPEDAAALKWAQQNLNSNNIQDRQTALGIVQANR